MGGRFWAQEVVARSSIAMTRRPVFLPQFELVMECPSHFKIGLPNYPLTKLLNPIESAQSDHDACRRDRPIFQQHHPASDQPWLPHRSQMPDVVNWTDTHR